MKTLQPLLFLYRSFFRLFVRMIACILLVCLHLNLVWARVDTVRTFPENRFAGGGMAFKQYMMSRIRYPEQAQQAAMVGTFLLSFVITPAGKLTSMAVVNSLGNAIDGEVTRVIRETQKQWLPTNQTESQDSIRLFLPFTFLLNSTKFYVEPVKPVFILDNMVIIGYNRFAGSSLQDDDYYLTKLNLALQDKNYKRMLKLVDELIRRNPYSDKLYFQRAKIERELGQQEDACRDYRMIIYFLGKTHFPKQLLKDCS